MTLTSGLDFRALYDVQEELGKGRFGMVHKVRHVVGYRLMKRCVCYTSDIMFVCLFVFYGLHVYMYVMRSYVRDSQICSFCHASVHILFFSSLSNLSQLTSQRLEVS